MGSQRTWTQRGFSPLPILGRCWAAPVEVDPAGKKYWPWRHRYPPTKDGRRQVLPIGPYLGITLNAAASPACDGCPCAAATGAADRWMNARTQVSSVRRTPFLLGFGVHQQAAAGAAAFQFRWWQTNNIIMVAALQADHGTTLNPCGGRARSCWVR